MVAFLLLGPVNLRAFPFCTLSSFSPPPLIPPRAVKSCLQAVWLPFHPVKGCVYVCVCMCDHLHRAAINNTPTSHKAPQKKRKQDTCRKKVNQLEKNRKE